MPIYCVKCRRKVMVAETEKVTMKKGRSGVAMEAWRGKCPKCGTMVYRISGKAKRGGKG